MCSLWGWGLAEPAGNPPVLTSTSTSPALSAHCQNETRAFLISCSQTTFNVYRTNALFKAQQWVLWGRHGRLRLWDPCPRQRPGGCALRVRVPHIL